MPDYTITPNPETHEFTVTERGSSARYVVTLFPYPKCMALAGERVCRCPGNRHFHHGRNPDPCIHIDAVERALIDARNAPESEANRLLIEAAYIPLSVAHRRTERAKKGISDAPIDEAVKRRDWMD